MSSLAHRLAVAFLAAVSGWIMNGCGVLFPPAKNAHAQMYADHVQVGQGYQRIDDYNGGEGSCGCDLDRWYIGPAGIDPAAVFTAPELVWQAWPDVPGDKLWEWLIHGTGYARDSGECDASVQRLRRSAGLFMYPDLWHLTRRQIDQWNAGNLDVFEVSFGCRLDGL